MAMFANMVTSLFREERIRTTDLKAKELRSVAEKLITLAKHGARLEAEAVAASLDEDRRRLRAQAIHKRRVAARTLRDPAVLSKLFGEIQQRYTDRPGGYTRILKLGQRKGDAAPISLIELVDRQVEAPAAPAEKKAEAEA